MTTFARQTIPRRFSVVLTFFIIGCSSEGTDRPSHPAITIAPQDDPHDDAESEPAAALSAPQASATPPADDSVRTDEDADSSAQHGRHALLVGCTTYDHLGQESHLRGPINDCALIREMLIQKFRFPNERVTVLSEDSGDDHRPIKANIVRELKHLGETVAPGDQVVVLLSGHGSQQPDNDPDNPDDPEPDGLDEIFCPADLKDEFEIVDGAVTIPNALSDDELRGLLGQIRSHGAFVWIIVDACHSGSAVRGTEAYRQLNPERFVPSEYLREARAKVTSATRGAIRRSEGMDLARDMGGLVAIYAAQPHEPTVEMPLPVDSESARWRGLLTFTMAQVLLQSSTDLTYKQLVQQIHSRYLQEQGRLGPTPLIEGDKLDQYVLQSHSSEDACPFILFPNEDGSLRVSGGELHGLAVGTILAVHPPAGSPFPDKVLGHVAVRAANVIDASVDPVAAENLPLVTRLPMGSRCRPLEVEFGRLALNVAVTSESAALEDQETLSFQFRNSIALRNLPVRLVDTADQAEWLINRDKHGIRLLPAAGWADDGMNLSDQFGPHPINEQLIAWIGNHLGKIARVHGLLKVCGTSQRERGWNWLSDLIGKRTCDVDLTFLLIDPATQGFTPIDWSQSGVTLADGDLAALQIKNAGTEAIDFSVLFIDSQFGITPLYPAPGIVADNRLDPEASFTVGPLQVEADSLGIEHLMVIASQARGQPADFTWLAQEQLGNRPAQRGVDDSPSGPVRQLFESALFTAPQSRGVSLKQTGDVAMQAISWRTIKREQ